MKKMIKKFRFVIATIVMMVSYSTIAFCDAQGAMSELIDKGMNIVAVIPGAIAVFSFINAGIASAQAHQEGGNAQAAAKMSSNLIAGVICVALVGAIFVVFKPIIAQLVS